MPLKGAIEEVKKEDELSVEDHTSTEHVLVGNSEGILVYKPNSNLQEDSLFTGKSL